jgi:cobyrinic acid a,c-diamide synthase
LNTRGRNRLGCLLISSPQGHSGKTTITIGLCDILRRRGLTVQPFKKGPDYIDPSWLALAACRPCHNLDLFLMPRGEVVRSFQHASVAADIGVVEGAMGLYDGMNGDGFGTTADLARLIAAPILLVVNSARMTGSIAAMVSGYQHFERDVNIAGVILNNVAGPRHERKLRDAVERHCGIPVVGSVPRNENFRISERHLGLVPSPEHSEAAECVERIGRMLEPHLDMEEIVRIAWSGEGPHPCLRQGADRPAFREEKSVVRGTAQAPKIGVIRDAAFNFYYPENLEALRLAGAELVFINSLRDRLPEIDGLYIGGGFPEFFLDPLEENRAFREEIRQAIEKGMPTYCECAGLMYLCREIRWKGRRYEMVGIIPAEVEMLERPQGHGYVIAQVAHSNPFFPAGAELRGHEFHHSRLILSGNVEFAYRLKRGHGIEGGKDGVVYKNLLGAYTHLHALGSPQWASAFVSLASHNFDMHGN